MWNHPTQAKSEKPLKQPSKLKGALALVIVAVLGAIAYFIVSEITSDGTPVARDRKSIADKGRKKTIDDKGVKPTTAKKEIVEDAQPVEATPSNKLQKIGNKYGTMVSCVTNVDGAIISEWILENGKKLKNVSTPQVFDNAADQVLAMLLNHDPGADMPPLPELGDLDLEFLKAMSKEIKINEDDTDAVKSIKQKVIDGRAQMMEYLRQGISFSTIAKEHHELITGNVQIRNDCIREIQKYVNEGDIESAVKYRDKANEVLRNSGIDEINMSLTPEEEAKENGGTDE